MKILLDALVHLCLELHPLDGPNAVISVNPAPGFTALKNVAQLKHLHITLEKGRVTNVNKNPVEKVIS